MTGFGGQRESWKKEGQSQRGHQDAEEIEIKMPSVEKILPDVML